MATIEQAPPPVAVEPEAPVASPLSNLMTRLYAIDWVTVYYVGIFIAAILTRFIGLGDRVMSHDESLHVKYSYDLYKGNGFQHTPLMHGPLLFHMTALMYFLFGDSDFSARLYPAILGIIMVLMPWLLFQRWLGKRGAMVASFMLLISPMILFHNRYIREDTPSIFFSLLMVYAIFAYVDGLQPRKIRWLLLLAAGTVLSLASKEVGFMYVGIFGSVLTLFWLVQVVQGLRAGVTKPIVGWVLGGVLAIAAILVIAMAGGGILSARFSPDDGEKIATWKFAAPIAVLLVAGLFLGLTPLRKLLVAVGTRANSMFRLVLSGVILGTIGALVMSFIWAVAREALPKDQPFSFFKLDSASQGRIVVWVTIMLVAMLLAVLIPALIRFARSPRLPWLDFAIVIGTALVSGIVLSYLEQRSLDIKENSITAVSNLPIILTWIICIFGTIGLVALRMTTPFFQEMKRYPIFDALVVMGTMILPWLTAFPVYLAGYKLDGGGGYDPATVQACILAGIPMLILTFAAGLCWNPTTWLLTAGTFYGIFFFFYTTIFTNMMGIFTGLVGSLGYWLAQQGVRRASQPQYFYFLQLSVYEFLPVIGAIAAGLAGIAGLWGFRLERFETIAARQAREAAEQQAALGDTVLGMPTESSIPGEPSALEVNPTALETESLPTAAELITSQIETTQPVSESGGENFAIFQTPEAQEAARNTNFWAALTNPVQELPPLEQSIPSNTGIDPAEVIGGLPFLPFTGYWAVLLTLALTMAGEKMPWMTTHLAVPMIFLSGWFLGLILDQIEWGKFFKQGWTLIILTPIFIIGLANAIGLWFGTNVPFKGTSSDQLAATFAWFGAALVTAILAYAIF
jgi:uncharacterized protein (TIGR03663 family)